MSSVGVKEKLMSLLEHTHQSLRTFAAELDPAARSRIGAKDDWSARDFMTHIAHWNQHICTSIEYAMRGDTLPGTDDFDAENDAVHAQYHQLPWDEALAMVEQTYVCLAENIKAITEEQLTNPEWVDWQKRPLLAGIIGTAAWHPEWHMVEYRLKYGEPDRAVEVYEAFSQQVMAISSWEVNHHYNLACLYALAGQPHKAIPPLRAAFDLRPEMMEWAKQDSDLAPLRGDPDFEALFAV